MVKAGVVARTLLACSLLAPSLLVSRNACACQDPPTIPCDLVPRSAIVDEGAPFEVVFSMTNLKVDPATGFPAPPMDDLDFTLTVNVDRGFEQRPGGTECFSTGEADPAAIVEPAAPLVVQLDDAWSPAADEPTSLTQVFRITPSQVWSSYVVTVTASDATGARSCVVSTCVTVQTASDAPQPWAEFVDPVKLGDGGEILPFDLMVHRDGYEPTHPLRVVVVPYNQSDAIDLFPIEPPELTDSTRGVIVTGEDELVRFTCHCHFPCYVGASNVYEVRLIDTVTGGWVWYSSYIGKALVDRSPLALVELVEIVDASGDGALEACEAGQVHVRLIGRHPFVNAPMIDMRMDLPLPAGVSVASWSLHHHDNPMDTVVPLPDELVATGVVTPGPTRFIVDSSRVAWRYETIPSHPPVFKDMVEAELLLDVAAGALQGPGSLDFAGFEVSGVVSGITRRETAPTLSIPILAGPRPGEVSDPTQEPLRVASDKRTLTWDGSAAALFDVFRGDIADLPRYGDCVRSSVAGPSFTDADTLPRDGAWFYLVAGALCGTEGPLGSDSLGRARIPDAPCP